MRLTVSEGNMTLKKPSTHRGTMPDSQELLGKVSAAYTQYPASFHYSVEGLFRLLSLGDCGRQGRRPQAYMVYSRRVSER